MCVGSGECGLFLPVAVFCQNLTDPSVHLPLFVFQNAFGSFEISGRCYRDVAGADQSQYSPPPPPPAAAPWAGRPFRPASSSVSWLPIPAALGEV